MQFYRLRNFLEEIILSPLQYIYIFFRTGEKFREVLTATFGLERFCTVPTNFRNRAYQSRMEPENKTETGLSLSTATTLGFKNHLSSPLPGSSGNRLMPHVEIRKFRRSSCSERLKEYDDHLAADDEMVVIIAAESTC